MSHKTAATVAHTIGIDTGKNTLHLIGLEDKGAIVLREKIARGDHGPARQCAAVPDRNRSWHGDALTMNFAIEKDVRRSVSVRPYW
jgi:hypothetical protein